MTKSNFLSKFLFVILGLTLTLGLFACDNADKQAAEAVDEAILALAEDLELDHESLIVAAREAYEALTDAQKAFVKNLTTLEAKEAAIVVLKDKAVALQVDNLILALPETVSLADKAAIEAARSAYNALTTLQKANVTKKTVLEAKEAALAALLDNNAKATLVIGRINDIPTELTLQNESAVISARSSYNALTEVQKALVTNYAKLEAAEEEIANLKLVRIVEELINSLPVNVILADEGDINAVRDAYENLSEANKAKVSNINLLLEAEQKIVIIKADIADLAEAQAWDLLVFAIPTTVTLAHKEDIQTVRAAYEALTAAQKALTTALFSLEQREEKIVNLEAAALVIAKIDAISETVQLSDENAIVEARTAYDALTVVQKALVTNYSVLLQKEEDFEIVKNPDLAVLLPAIALVPNQIVTDFELPTTGGVVWTVKSGQDITVFDIETGELLKTTYGVMMITLVATYGQTSREVEINFGLLEEGQTAIFYVGGTAGDKPADGPAWDGYGTYETQLEKAGFGGYMISVGNKVYFISKDAFIPLSGTTENEVISRETLRPYGLSAQSTFNNIGLVKGVATSYSGAGVLYYNEGSVAITFDASDTYGRLNVPTLGFGKIPFIPNEDGTYTVQKFVPDQSIGGDGNMTGSTDQVIWTLNPGEYLWAVHSWEVDYSNWGIGTRLCQGNNGVLLEGTIIQVAPYKIQDEDKAAVREAVLNAPKLIYNDTLLPKDNGVVWSLKNSQDRSIYDIETGELMQLNIDNKTVTFIVSKGDYSQEVDIEFGIMIEGKTQVYYNASGSNVAATGGTLETQIEWAGFGGFSILTDDKQFFIGKNAYIPISATEANTVITKAELRPAGQQDWAWYNIGFSKGVPLASSRGYGALYYNSGDVPVKFDLSHTYGRNNAASYGYGKLVFAPQADGTFKVNQFLADTGANDTTTTTEATMFVLNPGEYLFTPHTWEVSGTRFCQQGANNTTGLLQPNTIISIFEFKMNFPAAEVEAKIALLPEVPTLANEALIIEVRTLYNALSDFYKGYVSNLAKLEAAEEHIVNLKEAKIVIDMISALPEVITLANEDDVNAARIIYNDVLTVVQRALVTNLAKLEAAEQTIIDIKAANAVFEMIVDLPEVITNLNSALVLNARDEYDELTEAQKVLITNYDKLLIAESKLAVLTVINLINEISDPVFIEDEEAIIAARTAYDLLTVDEKLQVTNYNYLTNAELELANLKADEDAKANAKVVEDLINDLPDPLTLADETEVIAVRTAYQALTALEKSLVPNLATLQAAEAAIDGFKVDEVEVIIADLPDPITLADEDAVIAARAAYGDLPEALQPLVSNYAILTAAEEFIVSLKKVVAVEAIIANLPDPITLDDEDVVIATRTAYETLTESEKLLVSNYNVLVDAEDDIDALKVAVVETLIADLPDPITLANETEVIAVRSAVETLPESLKLLVSNLNILQAAEEKIISLKAVKNVIDLIDDLSDPVTLTDEAAVVAARVAYEALSGTEKLDVTNIADLQAAEVAIFNLQIASVEAQIASLPEVLTFDEYDDVVGVRAAYESLTAEQKAEITNLVLLTTAETTMEGILAVVMAEIVLETPTQILVNYPLDTANGVFEWVYKVGQDATCFDPALGKLLKVSMPITNRILVIRAVKFPEVAQEVTINFGLTPVGTTAVINGNDVTPADGNYKLSMYYTRTPQPAQYNGYSISFTRSAVKYQYFTVYHQDILPSTTNFKPSREATSIGIFYANKTGAPKEIPLADTFATSHAAYQKIVVDATGKVVEVIGTWETGQKVTIPTDGFFFVPLYLDAPISGNANCANFNMRAGWTVNDMVSIKRGQLNHMYPNLNDAVIEDDTYQIPNLNWSSSHPEIISSDGKITMPDYETQVTLTVGVMNGTQSVTVTVKGVAQTVAQVNQVIDSVGAGESIRFVGIVIGITSDNYFFVADGTGTIYVRSAATGLAIGDKVRIEGTTSVYTTNALYTRQISGTGIVITNLGSGFSNPLTPVVASYADLAMLSVDAVLTADEIAAIKAHPLYGKYVTVTGYVTFQGTHNNVFLTESLEPDSPRIYIFYLSSYYNELKLLEGKQITVSGPMYNYHTTDGWAIVYFGDIEVNLTDVEKEGFAISEITTVVEEDLYVMDDLDFYTKSSMLPNAFKDVTFSFSSSNSDILANDGTYTPPTTSTPINITVVVTFSDTHSKTYTFTVTALSEDDMPQILYTTGFESAEGFTASTVYNNQNPALRGPEGYQWSFYYGTPSTTGAISGSQSAQLRWYSTNNQQDNHGYIKTEFTLTNVGYVSFNALGFNGNNLKVFYSTDGENWLGEELFVLTTGARQYLYIINQEGPVYLKFVLVPNGTSGSRVTIDDIVVVSRMNVNFG